jgi:hypothetical protein
MVRLQLKDATVVEHSGLIILSSLKLSQDLRDGIEAYCRKAYWKNSSLKIVLTS